MTHATDIHETGIDVGETDWQTLYRVGALAPLIALSFYLVQIVLLIFGEPFPAIIEDWFALLQRSKLLGLLYLNALDILSIALIGIMFIALYAALRRGNESPMTIATYLALIGVVTFIAPRVAMLSVLSLSDQYVATTAETQRVMLLTAGETLQALGTATPQTGGFFFMAVAGLIVSLVILRGNVFNKATAYAGILAFFVTLANDISLILAPSVAAMLMPINGLLWLIWWLLISYGLFRLARSSTELKY